ncbi:tetratricopeptide repeat protein [Bacillus salacetis]|uniref:tetratricopeptide repeat protein n=1 Tax=Bacillus salacetis TaxID=2315464 RepID=UPI003BA11FE7
MANLSPLIIVFGVLVNTLVVLFACKTFAGKNHIEKGPFVWVIWMSIFLPGIGLAFGLVILKISKALKASEHLGHNDGLEHVKVRFDYLQEEARKDESVVPLTSVFMGTDTERQKDLILSMQDLGVSKIGKYLRLALKSPDQEIVHYAATTTNSVQEMFRKQIEYLKQNLLPASEKGYVEITNLYEHYVKSELLSDHWKKLISEEYITCLEDAVSLFPDNHFFYYRLAELMRSAGNKEESYEIYLTLIEKFPAHYEGYAGAVTHLYDGEKWQDLRKVIQQMNQHVRVEVIPRNLKTTLTILEGII